MSKDEPFLSRWSRLKRRAEEPGKAGDGEPVAKQEESVAATPPAQREPEAGKAPDEAAFDLPSLSDIDKLTADSDFSRFMDARVPSDLRHQALRKAWSVDPLIRDFIEVAENQYDWNAPDGVPGFGPMAAGTNVAALLHKVIGGGAEQAAAATSASRQVDDNLSHPAEQASDGAGGGLTGDSRPPQAAQSRNAEAGQNESQGDGSMTRPTHAKDRLSLDAATQLDGPEEADATSPQRRRHGGALPR